MKKSISVFVGIVCVLSCVFFVHYRAYNTVSLNAADHVFVVSEGDDIVTIGKNLAHAGLVQNRLYFYYYAWKNKLRGTFRADRYVIAPESTIPTIVYKFTTTGEGLVEKEQDIKITFPEGWTIKKMAERLTARHLPGDAFYEMAMHPHSEIYQTFSFLPPQANLEGYLFPDTYFFTKESTAEDIIVKMLTNFDQKVDSDYRTIIASQGKTLHDIIIFASIIEGEVPSDADRFVVAGVFQNRLDIGMALQSDATIDYIKGVSEIKHTYADTRIDSPYNTYMYPGLPPGPINNPSRASIDAAIAPAETEYMYFLNNATTGETVFSRTLDEHNHNKHMNGL